MKFMMMALIANWDKTELSQALQALVDLHHFLENLQKTEMN